MIFFVEHTDPTLEKKLDPPVSKCRRGPCIRGKPFCRTIFQILEYCGIHFKQIYTNIPAYVFVLLCTYT